MNYVFNIYSIVIQFSKLFIVFSVVFCEISVYIHIFYVIPVWVGRGTSTFPKIETESRLFHSR